MGTFFGSFFRREQTGKSDLDVLVVFSEDVICGVFSSFSDRLKSIWLDQTRGKSLILFTKNALKPMLKDQILKETVYA